MVTFEGKHILSLCRRRDDMSVTKSDVSISKPRHSYPDDDDDDDDDVEVDGRRSSLITCFEPGCILIDHSNAINPNRAPTAAPAASFRLLPSHICVDQSWLMMMTCCCLELATRSNYRPHGSFRTCVDDNSRELCYNITIMRLFSVLFACGEEHISQSKSSCITDLSPRLRLS